MQRVALVTGATRGIGKAIAISLARDGFAVIVTGRTLRAGQGDLGTRGVAIPVPGSIEETVAEIAAAGGTAVDVPLDLLSRDSIDTAIARTICQFGRLDVLVNNAIYQGPAIMEPIAAFGMEEAEANYLGNVVNQVHISRRAIDAMIPAGGGRLIFVTSRSSVMAATGHWGFLYGSAKAAFNKIPEFIQLEYGARGIHAFLVEPQFTLTDTIKARWGEAALSVGADHPPRDSSETADAVAWLAASPDAARFAGGTMWDAPDFFVQNGITPRGRSASD